MTTSDPDAGASLSGDGALGDGSGAAIEVHNVSKRYRPDGEVGFAPIPWMSGRRRRRRDAERRRDTTLFGDDDDEDDDGDDGDDLDDDLDDGFDDDFDRDELDDEQELVSHERDVWALRDVSFTVAPGTVIGVIGGTASGKSTLINVLSRVTPPTRGYVVTRGRVAPSFRVALGFIENSKSGVQCIFQLARFFGVPRAVAQAAVEPIRDLTELGKALDLPTRTYSSGQLLRLGFAITLCLDPDILLSDGVVAVGDPSFRIRSSEALKARIDKGLTMVFAAQDIRRLRDLCTHALLLREGRVEAFGTADEVVPQYEREFVTSAAARARQSPRRDPVTPVAPEGVVIETAGVYDMSGRPTQVMRTLDDALVELTFSVPDPPKRLRCVVVMFEGDLARVRLSQPDHFDAPTSGVYAASVHVPAGFIPPGAYEAKARVLEIAENERRTLDQAEFSLEAVGTEDRTAFGLGGRKLAWDVVRIGDLGAPGGGMPA